MDNDSIIGNEVSIYFDDIIRNKEMIKEMFKTNIMVYEDKIKGNKEKISTLQEELSKINTAYLLIENKLKLEYAKSHEQFQKHEINYKLLDKTYSHYKCLIREREDEIKKFEEQSIFAFQDYQNKKIKLDCLNVQIIEAEFQLRNLQNKFDEKVNQAIEKEESEYNEKLTSSTVTSEKRIENVEKYISDNLKYRSNYDNSSFIQNKEGVFDKISNSDKAKDNKCYIF